MRRTTEVCFVFFVGVVIMAHFALEGLLEGIFVAMLACFLLCLVGITKAPGLADIEPMGAKLPLQAVFWLRKSCLRIALLGTLISSVGIAQGLYDDNTVLQIGLGAVLVSQLWLLIAYWRHKLVLTEDQILLAHVIRAKTIQLSDVRRLRWHANNYSTLLELVHKMGKDALSLINYSPTARLLLVTYFRNRVSTEIQDGWTERIYRRAANDIVVL